MEELTKQAEGEQQTIIQSQISEQKSLLSELGELNCELGRILSRLRPESPENTAGEKDAQHDSSIYGRLAQNNDELKHYVRSQISEKIGELQKYI